ncbi:MAG: hypothetical protein ACXW6J_14250 [Candidatus Binatia bacterium]
MANLAVQTSIDHGIVFAPDELAQAQFYRTTRRTYYASPEHRLMAAVLEDAVATLTTDQRRCSKRQQRDFRDALAWLKNYGEDSVLSFETICEALAIDPDYLRQGLLRKIDQLHSGTMAR